MNDEPQIDDFARSLQHLTPGVPESTKARLMYECGIAAATAHNSPRPGSRTGTLVALILALGLGAFANQQLSNHFSQVKPTGVAVTPNDAHTDEPSSPLRQRFRVARQHSTLTVAMPFFKVDELLNRSQLDTAASEEDFSERERVPFGTLSNPAIFN